MDTDKQKDYCPVDEASKAGVEPNKPAVSQPPAQTQQPAAPQEPSTSTNAQEPPLPSPKSKPPSLFLIALVMVLITISSGLGYLIYEKTQEVKPEENAVVPTQALPPTTVPSPVPTEAVEEATEAGEIMPTEEEQNQPAEVQEISPTLELTPELTPGLTPESL